MLKVISVICGFAILYTADVCNASEWSSNLPKCRLDDQQCINNVFIYYMKKAANGIPSLNLQPIDPMSVDKMEVEQGNPGGPISLRIDLKNVTIVGYSNLKVKKVRGFNKDPHSAKFEVWGDIPRLTVTGQYTIKGSVLILPIVGDGKANFTFDNLDFHTKFRTSVVKRNGQDHLNLKKIISNFNTTRMYMHMDNLFNGDKLLGDTTNQFLDENWQVLVTELKPLMLKAIDDASVDIVKPVFDKIPYAELYDNSMVG